jgi:hypothetical protein
LIREGGYSANGRDYVSVVAGHRKRSRRNRDILLNSNRTLGNCDAKHIGGTAAVAFADSADEGPQRGGHNGDCAENGVNLGKNETRLGSWCDVDDKTID